jgi:hypothetical protein
MTGMGVAGMGLPGWAFGLSRNAADDGMIAGEPRCRVASMLHIAKLAVGVRDIDHIRALQAERLRSHPPLRHRTRNFPRRGNEVLDGGSLYWVISGSMLARQRILDIVEDERDDRTKCTSFILDPDLVPLIGRPTRPFQGWRYLLPDAAPADLDASAFAAGEETLPPVLRRELRALCLI